MFGRPRGASPNVCDSLGSPSFAQMKMAKWQPGVRACMPCSQATPSPYHPVSWLPCSSSSLGTFSTDGCWYPYPSQQVSSTFQTVCSRDYMAPNLPPPDLLQPCLPVQRVRPPPPFPELSHPQAPLQAEKKHFAMQQRSIHGLGDLDHLIKCLYGPFQPFGCRPVLLQLTGSTGES